MPLFSPANRSLSAEHSRIWAVYEIAYTAVDFTAALMFVIGSILFFWSETTFAATWLFLIGSVFFGLKPTLRLARELRLAALGKSDELARKLERD